MRTSLAGFIDTANGILGDGPLHGLVNNAGMSPKTPFKERLGCLNGDIGAWHEVFELNLFAPLKLARGFASALHRGKGAIVNITSIAGHIVPSIRRLGLFHFQGGAVRDDPRDGQRICPVGRACQRRRPGGN